MTSAPGKNIDVVADNVVGLKCGPPLSLAIKAESMRGMHYFSLNIKDASGASLSNIADAKGGRPSAPRLTISNAAGKVVKSIDFSYG